MDEAPLLALVAEFYEAALNPERLYGLSEPLSRVFGGSSGSLLLLELPSGSLQRVLAASKNFDEKAQSDYEIRYHRRNVWVESAAAARLVPPFATRGEDILDSRDFERTEFYSDWCTRVGVYHLLAGSHVIAPGVLLASAVYRERREPGFAPEDPARFRQVTAHLARAMQVAVRLGALIGERAIWDDIFEAVGLGVMLLDPQSRTVFLNRPVEALVRRKRWFAFRRARIAPVWPSEARTFATMVERVSRTSRGGGSDPGGVMRLNDPEGGPLPVLISPVRLSGAGEGLSRAGALVLFKVPEARPALQPCAVAAAFGLSRTEGALVAALASGKTLAQYSAGAGVSLNTAKTQLASVFDRTGYSRQASLVAEVAAHPMVRVASR